MATPERIIRCSQLTSFDFDCRMSELISAINLCMVDFSAERFMFPCMTLVMAFVRSGCF